MPPTIPDPLASHNTRNINTLELTPDSIQLSIPRPLPDLSQTLAFPAPVEEVGSWLSPRPQSRGPVEALSVWGLPTEITEFSAASFERIGALSGHGQPNRPQLATDEGPKLPKPWVVLRIAELQIAKTPRALRSTAFPDQST